MMLERASRTFICSVLFLDIIEYSRKPVAEQIQLKDRFNGLIAAAIREIPAADRIILDTGDGVVINFLADPEDALFVAMSLRDAFTPDREKPPEVPARIGINLGPVRMVKDLNGHPNIIGDGINVAQRVMGFGNAGQILVSRSYYELVSHISEGYTQLFSYEGSRTDKHVREHEIYSVGYSNGDVALKSPADRTRLASHERRRQTANLPAAAEHFLPRVRHWLNNRTLAYATAAFSGCAFLLALLTSFLATPPDVERPSQIAATSSTQQSAVGRVGTISGDDAANAVPGDATQGNSDADSTASATRSEPKPVKKRRLSFFQRLSKPEAEVVENTQQADDITPIEPASSQATTTAPESEAIAGDRATLVLAVTPWGEIFIDGKSIGVSPPVNEVEVFPGRRTIEIRNGDFPPFIQKVELKAGQEIKIRHKFN